MVAMECNSNLPEIAAALRAPRSLPNALDGGQQQGGKYENDRHAHEQVGKCVRNSAPLCDRNASSLSVSHVLNRETTDWLKNWLASCEQHRGETQGHRKGREHKVSHCFGALRQ